MILDDLDRAIIHATQKGLPLSRTPFLDLADSLKTSESEIFTRLKKMQDSGIIRRIAAVPNHYALGVLANAMSVWDVADDFADSVGAFLGAQKIVSHAYLRCRHLPQWRFNIFAMIHAATRAQVFEMHQSLKAQIESQFPQALFATELLFSTQILKKTGARFFLEQPNAAH